MIPSDVLDRAIERGVLRERFNALYNPNTKPGDVINSLPTDDRASLSELISADTKVRDDVVKQFLIVRYCVHGRLYTEVCLSCKR
jgi:hypothetical protein